MRISVVMIVKNEEDLLARCLESVKGADEIIICDTGSHDRTVEIARQFTDKVFTDYLWNDSYCEARNHARRKATGDWILSIDADEFLEGSFDSVREAAAQAQQAVHVNLYGEGNRQWHEFPRLFKNAPNIFWTRDVHNIPNVPGERVGNVCITYGYSPAHLKDPDRSLRILERSVRKNPEEMREVFYLGREYWYRRRYDDCVRTLGRYVVHPTSQAYSEKSDAFLIMARAYWAMTPRDANSARDACLQAVALNPTWYEPAEFMAYASGLNSGDPRLEANAAQWMRMAASSTNEHVLFFRPPGPETPIARYPEGFEAPAVEKIQVADLSRIGDGDLGTITSGQIEAPRINDPIGIPADKIYDPIGVNAAIEMFRVPDNSGMIFSGSTMDAALL